jgi:hypothetical protein
VWYDKTLSFKSLQTQLKREGRTTGSGGALERAKSAETKARKVAEQAKLDQIHKEEETKKKELDDAEVAKAEDEVRTVSGDLAAKTDRVAKLRQQLAEMEAKEAEILEEQKRIAEIEKVRVLCYAIHQYWNSV